MGIQVIHTTANTNLISILTIEVDSCFVHEKTIPSMNLQIRHFIIMKKN